MVCFGVVEVDCLGLADTFVLGGDFVVVMVVEVGLVVGYVLKLVLWCSVEGVFFVTFEADVGGSKYV